MTSFDTGLLARARSRCGGGEHALELLVGKRPPAVALAVAANVLDSNTCTLAEGDECLKAQVRELPAMQDGHTEQSVAAPGRPGLSKHGVLTELHRCK